MRSKFRDYCANESILQQMKKIAGVTILLFIILILLINKYTRQIIYENADEHTKISSIQLQNQLELIYNKIENFAASIEEDESIRKLMASTYPQLAQNITGATQALVSHKILESSIEDISLVNDIVHHSYVYSYEEMDEIRNMVQGNSFQWIGIKEHHFIGTNDMPDMLVYAGDIMEEGENLGTVIFSIDLSSFPVENMGETNSVYFLADEQGIMHTFNCSEDIAGEIYEVWEKNKRADSVKTGDYYIHTYYLEDMECYLLGTLRVKGGNFGLNRVQILVWCCVLLVIIYWGIYLFLVSKEIILPLRRFSQKIREMSEQHKRHVTEKLSLGGCAEITDIEREFTSMLESLDTLNHQILRQATELYEVKVQKQEAELAYLRSQIDPHFLYNTLEVFRTIALERHVPEIAGMAADMGNIFRYSTKGEDVVRFEEELSIVKSYVRIQQMRFGEKIEVFYFVPDEVLSCRVIKMFLQPVVENAVFHGLECKKENGKLLIGARKEEDRLIVTVMDDGVGIGRERLSQIKRALESEMPDTSKHVGILNTNARIKMQYGKEYGLTLESNEGDGTVVTMVLPVKQTEEEGICFGY